MSETLENPFLGHGACTDCLYRANGDFDLFDDSRDDERFMNKSVDASDYIVDIREYDVPYHVRVMIDLGTSEESETCQPF